MSKFEILSQDHDLLHIRLGGLQQFCCATWKTTGQSSNKTLNNQPVLSPPSRSVKIRYFEAQPVFPHHIQTMEKDLVMFLQPNYKPAKKVNVQAALYSSVVTSRGEDAAAMIVGACRNVQQLRSAAHEPPTSEKTREGLLRYHRVLKHILDDCRVLGSSMMTTSTSSSSANNWEIPLLWTSSLDPEKFAEVSDLRIDVLGVLFNLGVNEAELASEAYRDKSSDGFRTAAKRFQAAAGFFDAASEMPTPGGVGSVTSDVWPTTLKGLRCIMLGNAQHVFLEICKVNNTSMAVQARLAAGIRDFYSQGAASLDSSYRADPLLMGMLGNPAAALAAYFDVVTVSNAASGARQSGQIGMEIARLSDAKNTLEEAKKAFNKVDANSSLPSVQKIHKQLSDRLVKMEHDLITREETAKEENRKFYFDTLPDQLPSIMPHLSVKVAKVKDILNAVGLPQDVAPFSDLPPAGEDCGCGIDGIPSASIAGRYSVATIGYVADCVAKAVTSSLNARAALDEIGQATKLAGDAVAKMERAAIEASPFADRLGTGNYLSPEEQRAVDAVRLVQTKGGTPALRKQQMQVVVQAKKATEQIELIEKMLRDEEEQDTKLRSYAPGRRPNSMQLTSEFRSKLGQMRTNLEQAANADKIIGHELDEYGQPIIAIMQVDVDTAVNARLGTAAKMSRSINNSGDGNEVAAISRRLSELQSQAETLFAKQDDAVEALEAKRRKEKPLIATAKLNDESSATAGAEADAFNQLMESTYGALRKNVQDICASLDANTAAVRTQLKRLRELTKGAGRAITEVDEGTRAMLELFKHETAALKFSECFEHLQQGMSFYVKESENVKILHDQVAKYCKTRNDEFQWILSEGGGSGGSGSGGGGGGYMSNIKSFYPTGGSGGSGGSGGFRPYPQ